MWMVPKARIGNGNSSSKQGDNNNVDDWQSCWVDEAEDARDGGQFNRPFELERFWMLFLGNFLSWK